VKFVMVSRRDKGDRRFMKINYGKLHPNWEKRLRYMNISVICY